MDTELRNYGKLRRIALKCQPIPDDLFEVQTGDGIIAVSKQKTETKVPEISNLHS
jgi:hypothetical protein